MPDAAELAPPRPADLRSEVVSGLPFVVLVLAAVPLLHRFGVPVQETLSFLLVVAVTQVAPGAVVWRACRPVRGWLLEDVAMGAGIGAALAVPAQVLDAAAGGRVAAWGLPWLVVLVLLAVGSTRRRIASACRDRLPWWWGVATALVSVPVLAFATDRFAQDLPGEVRWATQYVDLPYHQALVGELMHRFPPHSPQVASQPLDYHWFSHAWMAQLSVTSGVGPDLVLLRLTPVYLAVVLCVLAAFVGMRLVGYAAIGPVGAFAAAGVSALPVPTAWGVNALVRSGSPSTGYAFLILFPLVALLVLRWRGRVPWATVLPVVFLAAALAGAKGSFLPVLVVGSVVALVAARLGREPVRRILLDSAVLVVVLVLALLFLFKGNDGGMQLAPFTALVEQRAATFLVPPPGGVTVAQGILVTVLGVLGLALPFAGALLLLRRRSHRHDPALWLLLGAAAAGAGALLVFTHPGQSQFYFWFAGAPLGGLAAVWGLLELVRGHRAAVLAAVAGAVAGPVLVNVRLESVRSAGDDPSLGRTVLDLVLLLAVLLLAGFLCWLCTRRRAALGLLLASALVAGLLSATSATALHRGLDGIDEQSPRPAGPDEPGSVSRGQVAAARYIAEHAGPEDLVMTNRHCRTPGEEPACDHRTFWVAAYGQHRVLVEGWAYTRRANASPPEGYNTRTRPFWDQDLLRLNDSFYVAPTREKAERLHELGVRWVYVDTRLPHVPLDDYAELVFRSPTALVYRLDGP